MKVVQGLHNGVTTRELDQLAAEVCKYIALFSLRDSIHNVDSAAQQARILQPFIRTGASLLRALPSRIFTKRPSLVFRKTATRYITIATLRCVFVAAVLAPCYIIFASSFSRVDGQTRGAHRR